MEDAKRFEEQFLAFMDASHADIGKEIRSSSQLPEELENRLREAALDFKRGFQPSDGGTQVGTEAEAQPLTEEEQERLKKYRRPTPVEET